MTTPQLAFLLAIANLGIGFTVGAWPWIVLGAVLCAGLAALPHHD